MAEVFLQTSSINVLTEVIDGESDDEEPSEADEEEEEA